MNYDKNNAQLVVDLLENLIEQSTHTDHMIFVSVDLSWILSSTLMVSISFTLSFFFFFLVNSLTTFDFLHSIHQMNVGEFFTTNTPNVKQLKVPVVIEGSIIYNETRQCLVLWPSCLEIPKHSYQLNCIHLLCDKKNCMNSSML